MKRVHLPTVVAAFVASCVGLVTYAVWPSTTGPTIRVATTSQTVEPFRHVEHDPPTFVTSTTVHHTVTVGRAASYAPAYSLEVVNQIRAGFARFGPDVAEQAVRVAGCETGDTYDPRAANGSHFGLFEINVHIHAARIARLGYTPEQMLEAGPNIAVAVDLFAESGWGPWTCRRVA